MKHDWGFSEKLPFSILWESGVSWSWRKEIIRDSPKRWPFGWALWVKLSLLVVSHPKCPKINVISRDIQRYLLPAVFCSARKRAEWYIYFGRSYGFFKCIFHWGPDVFERPLKKSLIFFSPFTPMFSFLNFQRCRHCFWVNLQQILP